MTYRVDLTAVAARQIKKLPRPARDRVLDAIKDLAEDPRPHGARKLVGEQQNHQSIVKPRKRDVSTIADNPT